MAAFTALQLFLLNNQVKRADLFDVGVSNATCKEPSLQEPDGRSLATETKPPRNHPG